MSIAGATGSGNSEFLKLLLYSACQKQDERNLEIHIIYLKGGSTFLAWKHAQPVKDIYRTTAEALGCLMAIEGEMSRRLDIINQARYAVRPDPWFKEAVASSRAEDIPLIRREKTSIGKYAPRQLKTAQKAISRVPQRAEHWFGLSNCVECANTCRWTSR